MIWFAKKPASGRWERQEDQHGPCDSAPHAASTFASIHVRSLGETVEVMGQTEPPRDVMEVQVFTVISIGSSGAAVQWVGSRKERP